jgi:hypothetical protein
MKIKLKLSKLLKSGNRLEINLSSEEYNVEEGVEPAEVAKLLWDTERAINDLGAVRAHISMEGEDGTPADTQQANSGRA